MIIHNNIILILKKREKCYNLMKIYDRELNNYILDKTRVSPNYLYLELKKNMDKF